VCGFVRSTYDHEHGHNILIIKIELSLLILNATLRVVRVLIRIVQGDSNMTGTDLCVNKPHKSRSYLNHLVYLSIRFTLRPFYFRRKAPVVYEVGWALRDGLDGVINKEIPVSGMNRTPVF
jgi:hypothetical protein